jgi:type I site-specific restriction endonuclease
MPNRLANKFKKYTIERYRSIEKLEKTFAQIDKAHEQEEQAAKTIGKNLTKIAVEFGSKEANVQTMINQQLEEINVKFRELEELRIAKYQQINNVAGEAAALIGWMLENREFIDDHKAELTEQRMASAHVATFVGNIAEFMKSHTGFAQEWLEIVDPGILGEALKNLPKDKFNETLDAVLEVAHERSCDEQ